MPCTTIKTIKSSVKSSVTQSKKKCSSISKPRSNRAIIYSESFKNATKMPPSHYDEHYHSSKTLAFERFKGHDFLWIRHKLDESAIELIRRRSTNCNHAKTASSPVSYRRSDLGAARVSHRLPTDPKPNVKVLSSDEKLRLKGTIWSLLFSSG